MIPECSESGELRIYQMQEDIYHWKLCSSFSNMEGIVDTCVCQVKPDDEGIYLLTSKERKNPLLNERKLFKLSLDFKEIIDVSAAFGESKVNEFEARNGGKTFYYGGELHRVAQVSTEEVYGKECIIAHVKQCNEESYVQEEITRIGISDITYPHSKIAFKPIGIHTYGLENGLELVDICARSYRVKNIIVKHMK